MFLKTLKNPIVNNNNTMIVEFKGHWNHNEYSDCNKLKNFTLQNGEYGYQLGVFVKLKENNYELQNPSAVSPEGLKALESAVYEHIEQLIKISSQSNCDFFQLKNLLYQKHNKHYASLKDGILNNLSYEIKVTCKSKSKA